MITKNSICKLIKNFKSLITSDEFKQRHCTESASFTKNRKLSFQDVLLFLLGLPQKSLPTELDLYFEPKNITVSKQAFSKARYQISELAFKEIFELTTDVYTFTDNPKTWDGFRIFAVDGSDIAVPHNKKTEEAFGIFKNKNVEYPMARLTALYDAANDLIVDAQFTGIDAGEREHAINLLSSPALSKNKKTKKLILFDRSYPSRDLIHKLEGKGLYYVIRCYTSFISCVNKCPDGDHIVTDHFKGCSTKLRVIKETTGDETHILISNLFEQHQDKKYHQDLYHRRWEIETKYGELKTRIRLENFSGKNPQAVYQDLYAALFISNLSSLIKAVSEEEMENTLHTSKHKYQLNRSYIIGMVSRYVKKAVTSYGYRKKLNTLMLQVQRMKSIIRPDRHFSRGNSHHNSTNGFFIRVNI